MKHRDIAMAMVVGDADQSASEKPVKGKQIPEISTPGIKLSLDQLMVSVSTKTDNPACRKRYTAITRGMA